MKVLIAMSGGVDSAVAALLMVKAGYECTGITMRLRENPRLKSTCLGTMQDRKSEDEWFREEHDAAKICDRLGINHIVADFSASFFDAVVKPFIDEYEAGGTPNPCVECNKKIKFGKLLDFAIENGYDKLVTGHYASIDEICSSGEIIYVLKKAADERKDQSYFLHGLNQHQLSHVIFPLGGMQKDEVRQLAEENGFVNAHKRDSQDICFVPDGDYVHVIESITEKDYPCGDFIGPDGKKLGDHKGIISYTIGQRKGLGLSLPEPLYVVKKDVESNKVILGRNDELFSKELIVKDANIVWGYVKKMDDVALTAEPDGKTKQDVTAEPGWKTKQIVIDESAGKTKQDVTDELDVVTVRVMAKTRYSHKAQPATAVIRRLPAGRDEMRIVFDEPQRAITPGQSAVIYSGDYLVGGGVIG